MKLALGGMAAFLMCALAGTYRNPHTHPERYIGIVLDGLRVPGAGHAELPAIVEP